jgi:predicted enzyme related to lactoylglutathione lyase
MPNVEKHAPGSFCWIELATTDQNAAKQFYTSLFGWAVEDFPLGPEGSYSMFSLQGRSAGAAYTLRSDDREQGVPPHWMLYVDTDDADESVNRAVTAGGKALSPAFDVMTFGRMAALQDPTGAIFSVWQPKSHIGTGITGVDGTLCWADLMTADAEAAKKFYSAVFGWQLTPGEKDPSGYLHIKNGEQYIGGVPPGGLRPGVPAHWLAYFLVSDCDASTSKATQLGAKVYMPPTSMEGVGRWSVIADPQGASFALFQPPPHF